MLQLRTSWNWQIYRSRSTPFSSTHVQSAHKASLIHNIGFCSARIERSIHVIGFFVHYDCFVQSAKFRSAPKAFQLRSNYAHDPITFRSDCQFHDVLNCIFINLEIYFKVLFQPSYKPDGLVNYKNINKLVKLTLFCKTAL